MDDGFTYKGVHVRVELRAVICDAPAWSFLKQVKSHTGYYGCEKCLQKGVYCCRKVTFPELNAAKRTNSSFRNKEQPEHHTGTSPFLALDCDIVKLFPADYMHLVCLGIVRKLLMLWVRGTRPHCLSATQCTLLSNRLRACRKNFPTVFQRRPRGVEELERWKATEFRNFVLYLGPVVLKGLLPTEKYHNFLLLHTAIRILASIELSTQYNTYAQDLLNHFIETFRDIYGAEHLVYNVHTLSHLAEDCLTHGALDCFSAFPFENFLGKLKRILRSGNKPLSQISRRLSEGVHVHSAKQVRKQVRIGSCYIVNGSVPVCVDKVNGATVEAHVLNGKSDFFSVPLSLSQIDIYLCSRSTSSRTFALQAIQRALECVCVPHNDRFVVISML
ncbi:uncharacterized protein LOC135388473 [Ornithodoros turicata]|uniref:uncharacterized protein LOC135388473 n=1 Tax=Ornithodoros turicata TaxID=34597 RepID=UPI0031392753